MKSPITGYLDTVLAGTATSTSGSPADYIPELAAVDPDQAALALATADGTVYGAGDLDVEFTIQSVSKAFVYALALVDAGPEEVARTVDVEPSGEAFNEISVDERSGHPRNPMINAGAIAVHSLICGVQADAPERVERILTALSALAGRQLTVDEEVYQSEIDTAWRNLAIANMLRAQGALRDDPRDVVTGYTRQCAIKVTARDLALMGATLAAGGVQPRTGEQVIPSEVVRQVLSVMTTCGMYDAAGDWVSHIGIPAKSGVSGAILGVLPGQFSIAAFSPRLDEHGHSVRGVQMFERLSTEMRLHLMEPTEHARATLHSASTFDAAGEPVRVYSIQGALHLAAAERVVRSLTSDPPTERQIALDLRRVSSINPAARQMLLSVLRELVNDGHEVNLVDEHSVFDDPDLGSEGRARVVPSLDRLR